MKYRKAGDLNVDTADFWIFWLLNTTAGIRDRDSKIMTNRSLYLLRCIESNASVWKWIIIIVYYIIIYIIINDIIYIINNNIFLHKNNIKVCDENYTII